MGKCIAYKQTVLLIAFTLGYSDVQIQRQKAVTVTFQRTSYLCLHRGLMQTYQSVPGESPWIRQHDEAEVLLSPARPAPHVTNCWHKQQLHLVTINTM